MCMNHMSQQEAQVSSSVSVPLIYYVAKFYNNVLLHPKDINVLLGDKPLNN